MPEINQFIKKLIIKLPCKISFEERNNIFNDIKEDLIKTFNFDSGFFTEIFLSSKCSDNEYVKVIIDGVYPIADQEGYQSSAEVNKLCGKYSAEITGYLKKYCFK